MDQVTLAMLGYMIAHLWFITYQLGILTGKIKRICAEINAKREVPT